VEFATTQPVTPEIPTVEAPIADVPTLELSTPEPAPQEDVAPDYVPAAWEVVFAAFPELYPDHAALACAAVAVSSEKHAPPSHAPERRRALVFTSRPVAAKRMRTAGSVADAPWRTGVPPASRRRREESDCYSLFFQTDLLADRISLAHPTGGTPVRHSASSTLPAVPVYLAGPLRVATLQSRGTANTQMRSGA